MKIVLGVCPKAHELATVVNPQEGSVGTISVVERFKIAVFINESYFVVVSTHEYADVIYAINTRSDGPGIVDLRIVRSVHQKSVSNMTWRIAEPSNQLSGVVDSCKQRRSRTGIIEAYVNSVAIDKSMLLPRCLIDPDDNAVIVNAKGPGEGRAWIEDCGIGVVVVKKALATALVNTDNSVRDCLCRWPLRH
jgi:hypothetical protein